MSKREKPKTEAELNERIMEYMLHIFSVGIIASNASEGNVEKIKEAVKPGVTVLINEVKDYVSRNVDEFFKEVQK